MIWLEFLKRGCKDNVCLYKAAGGAVAAVVSKAPAGKASTRPMCRGGTWCTWGKSGESPQLRSTGRAVLREVPMQFARMWREEGTAAALEVVRRGEEETEPEGSWWAL